MARALKIFVPLLILGCIAFLYSQVGEFQYVWDDMALFVDDPALRSGFDLEALARRILPGSSYFRPLVLGSFSLEFWLFGLDSGVSHFVNLFIHLLNVALVGWIAFMLDRNGRAVRAWIAMLLYGFHPALIEPVAWVAGRFDLMVTFFCLAGVGLSIRFGSLGMGVCALMFLCAALSKEMALVFPVLVFFAMWAKEAPYKRLDCYVVSFFSRYYRLVILILFWGVVALLLRDQFQGGVNIGDKAVDGASWIQRLAMSGYSIAFYVSLVVWPYPMLGALHPFSVLELTSAEIYFGLSVFVVYWAAVVYLLLLRGQAALILAAALLGLFPVIQILPLNVAGNIGHARFLTLPLAFFVLALVCLRVEGVRLSAAMHRVSGKLLGVLLALWLSFTVMNVSITLPLWSNGMTLWGWMYGVYPDNWLARYNYLSSLIMYRDYERLRGVFEEVKARSGDVSGSDNLIYADYLRVQGRYEEALDRLFLYVGSRRAPHREVLAKGVSLSGKTVRSDDFPYAGNFRYAFGVYSDSYFKMRLYEKALDSAETMRFYSGDTYGPTYVAYGRAYYGLGRFKEGDEAFEHAKKVYPKGGDSIVDGWRNEALEHVCRVESSLQAKPECLSFVRVVGEN